MLCSIIPYSRSFDDTLLTYSLPEEFRPFVKIGSSVYVPFGKETIIGIVADISKEIAYEWEVKPITRPHCTVPWLSSSEIALLLALSRRLFLRLHVVAQLLLPLWVFGLFEKQNFLDLEKPISTPSKSESQYIVAPDEKSIIEFLETDTKNGNAAIILPEGVSVKSWASRFDAAVVDHHPKSVTTQRNIYLDILKTTHPLLIGTRRTLLKRIGGYSRIYILYDYHASHILFGQKSIPLHVLAEILELHGHSVHYITTTPSIRILCDFLQKKKSLKYL